MFINNLYLKECFLFYNYSNFISFLKKIRKENKDKFIMFLSRDSYFLYLLYGNMYPELKLGEDYAYIFSSRQCFSERNKDYYKNYIESYREKNDNILMVDVYGTGTSFLNFINYYELDNIKLLFFCHNNTEVSYLEHRNKKDVEGFITDNNGIIFENIFRAPHYKVIGVKKDFTPIVSRSNNYDKTDIINDKDKKFLLSLYKEIIENIPFNKNIRYFTLGLFNCININETSHEYTGLIVLDIDNTITNVRDYKYLRELVKECEENNIKIILVTARQSPYKYGDLGRLKISNIQELLDKIGYDYKSNIIDIWYNPYCFVNENANKIKYLTIEKNMNIFGIKKDKVIFFDDALSNVKYTGEKGILSRLVIVNKGFDEECLKLFYSVFKEKVTRQVSGE